MLNKFKMLGAAAALTLISSAASAVTVSVDDLSTVGIDASTSGVSTALFSGVAGGFNVNVAVGTISSPSSTSYALNTTSIETSGVGTLQITVEELALAGFPSYPTMNLAGFGSITDIGETITVEHFINFGAGYQTVGSALSFSKAGGNSQAKSTDQTFVNATPFDLKTIVTIFNSSKAFTSNVNATLIASVPVPAAGLLLLGALGGFGALRRRKKATA